MPAVACITSPPASSQQARRPHVAERAIRAHRLLVLAVALLAGSAIVGPASASEGAREINQTCASMNGCFTGDATGFPVTISAGGRYILTSNLVLTDANVDAIVVTANDVDIDLNGFEIAGPVACTGEGAAVSCTSSSATGRGIAGPTAETSKITDGSVRGFAAGGIRLGARASIRRVTSESNGAIGIEVGAGSSLAEAISYQNVGAGVSTGASTLLERCIAFGNAGAGVTAGQDATLSAVVARENGGDGVSIVSGGLVAESTASSNGQVGIRVGAGTHVRDSTATGNGADGIVATAGAGLVGCVARGNTGFGLALAGASYRRCTVTANAGGSVDAGLDLGANACNGATSCP